MIAGTSYCPAKAFINFARDFFEALSKKEYGLALSRLDMSTRKWSKKELMKAMYQYTDGKGISTPTGIKKSSSFTVEEFESQNGYRLKHTIPCDGKWSNCYAVFKFQRTKGDYFKVVLEGFEI